MTFKSLNISIQFETATDEADIEKLAAITFGPGRFSRSAFRLREGVENERELSFVAKIDNVLIGSVKLTKIMIGANPSLLLGPIMVSKTARNLGVGRELMVRSIKATMDAGHGSILLVGDYGYYNQFGFEQVKHGKIAMPGPADPARILFCELIKGEAEKISGVATRFVKDS